MLIDLLFVTHNRVEFTEAAFGALIANTDWENVHKVYVADDGSEDGTRDYLDHNLERIPVDDVIISARPFGGPVAATNWYLRKAATPDEDVPVVVKIDNDIIVPPGWLEEIQRFLTANPDLDILGLPSMNGHTKPGKAQRVLEDSDHIGGVGAIRKRVFDTCRPVANGRWGWTQWQTRHPEFRKAWLRPALPCFELDRLPFDPWRSLAASYCERGWSRPWPAYAEDSDHLWGWWRS